MEQIVRIPGSFFSVVAQENLFSPGALRGLSCGLFDYAGPLYQKSEGNQPEVGFLELNKSFPDVALEFRQSIKKLLDVWNVQKQFGSFLFLNHEGAAKNKLSSLRKFLPKTDDLAGYRTHRCFLDALLSARTLYKGTIANAFAEYQKIEDGKLFANFKLAYVTLDDAEKMQKPITDVKAKEPSGEIMNINCEFTKNGSAKCKGKFKIFDSEIDININEVVTRLADVNHNGNITEALNASEKFPLECKNDGNNSGKGNVCGSYVAEQRPTSYVAKTYLYGKEQFHMVSDAGTTDYRVFTASKSNQHCPYYLGQALALLAADNEFIQKYLVL